MEKRICDYMESIWKSILSLDVKPVQNGKVANSDCLIKEKRLGCDAFEVKWQYASILDSDPSFESYMIMNLVLHHIMRSVGIMHDQVLQVFITVQIDFCKLNGH